ncbi:hypothetical protein EC12741_0852 [Escherichia coli 1.2741]|nr:hypothetical protein EC12741_0852 [Escherichia coli 1.2741]
MAGYLMEVLLNLVAVNMYQPMVLIRGRPIIQSLTVAARQFWTGEFPQGR